MQAKTSKWQEPGDGFGGFVRLPADADCGLVRAWLFLTALALGIAGVLAFFVAMIKTPAITPWFEPATFRLILVAHVTWAMTIWCLMAVASMWVYLVAAAGGRFTPVWSRVNLALTQLGGLGILAAMVWPGGGALLLDYVPLIDAPVYYWGYALFMLGIVSEMLRFVVAWRRGVVAPGPATTGMLAAAAIVLVGLLTLAWDWFDVARDDRVRGAMRLQPIVWGVGHVFQYIYVTAMAIAWLRLTEVGMGVAVRERAWLRFTFVLAGLLSLSTPVGSLLLGAVDLRHSLAASVIILSLLAVIAVFAAVPVVRAGGRRRREGGSPLLNPAFMSLSVSMLLFTIGVLMDPSGKMGTLWVPAHYHGVIVGGVTIALMGMVGHMMQQAGWWPRSPGLATWQPLLFGAGVATMIAGLAWAGAAGAVRKDWVHGFVVDPGFNAGLNLMGFGALVAVIGGAMFVLLVLFSLARRRRPAALDIPREAG